MTIWGSIDYLLWEALPFQEFLLSSLSFLSIYLDISDRSLCICEESKDCGLDLFARYCSVLTESG